MSVAKKYIILAIALGVLVVAGLALWEVLARQTDPASLGAAHSSAAAPASPRRTHGGVAEGDPDPRGSRSSSRFRHEESSFRNECEEVENELADVKAQLAAERAMRAQQESRTDHQLTVFNLSPDQKRELAERCELRADIPMPLDAAEASDLGLSASDQAAWDRAWGEFARKDEETLEKLWGEATGEEALPENWMGAMDHVREELPPDLKKRLAEERAGMREPPGNMKELSPSEQLSRAFWDRGNAFEQALATELGPERARELRSATDGWPGDGRWFEAGCPEE